MNLRTLSVTVAVLALLSLATWLLRRPGAPAAQDARVNQPVLAADLARRVAALRIVDRGRTTTLARQSDGSWRVTAYHDLPADFAKLSRLIGDLTDAKIQRLVTARPDRLARLEFKDATITLFDAGAAELWSITLGKTADGGGRFLRYGAEEKGYQADLNLWLDPEPRAWADVTLLNLKPDDVAAVEIGFADGANVSANRAKKEDAWTAPAAPAGKRLKSTQVASLLNHVCLLRFAETVDLADPGAAAAREHQRTVKLTTFGGRTYSITLARKPEEKKPKPVAVAVPESNPPAPPAANEPGAPAAPEFETIPAGPVYAAISCSDEKAVVNELMRKRAYQVGEWTFTGLPASSAELWEDQPAPVPASEKSPEPIPAAAPAG